VSPLVRVCRKAAARLRPASWPSPTPHRRSKDRCPRPSQHLSACTPPVWRSRHLRKLASYEVSSAARPTQLAPAITMTSVPAGCRWWWAWEDLNLRLHPERKIARLARALPHQGEPSLAGHPDSHPSWRPPAMGVLSAKCREPLCYTPLSQVAFNRRGRSYVLS
jgi:hypothetical protein